MAKRKKSGLVGADVSPKGYETVLGEIVELLESARSAASRSINAVMTAAYWEIGRRIVEFEQGGKDQADYGSVLVTRLAEDLSQRLGRGFGKSNLYQMRAFYLTFRDIFQTLSGKLDAGKDSKSQAEIFQTLSGKSPSFAVLAKRFPLPWSHYVKLLALKDKDARQFYESEAMRGGRRVRTGRGKT